MSLLSELTTIATGLDLPVETGVFSDTAPNEYLVLIPLTDTLDLHADNTPGGEIQEVRMTLYTKGNYTQRKNTLSRALIRAEITITDRRYMDDLNHSLSDDVDRHYLKGIEIRVADRTIKLPLTDVTFTAIYDALGIIQDEM